MKTIEQDFKILVDENIQLRLPYIEEAEILYALTDKNRSYLREYFGWVDGTTSPEDTEFFLKFEIMKALALEELSLTIWFKDYPIGFVGLQSIDKMNHSARIGYWIDKDHQGRGIMTKCVKALIDFAFRDLALHRMEILCAVHNIKSQKVPMRLGFTLEGTLKEVIWHYGKYFDAHLYALINHMK